MEPESSRRTRRDVLRLGAGALVLPLAGCAAGGGTGGPATGGTPSMATEPESMATATSTSGSWRETALTDVRTGESFTVAQFADRPVLLETFAVWCPTCTRQQQQLVRLRARRDDVVVITLDVDPNEDAEKVREHLETHEDFDWRYAVAPSAMTRSLIDEFGTVIANPPAAPIVRVCPDGTAKHIDQRGVKSAETLAGHLARC